MSSTFADLAFFFKRNSLEVVQVSCNGATLLLSGSLAISHVDNTIKSEVFTILDLDVHCGYCMYVHLRMLCTAFAAKSLSVEECPPGPKYFLQDLLWRRSH